VFRLFSVGRPIMPDVQIARWIDLPDRGKTEAAIEAIFFAASGTQTFASEAAKMAFRERWLGRFLQYDSGHVFVAIDPRGEIAGYLIGSLDDPARTARFSDIGYFAGFAELTARYPAHLHVNLDATMRGSGIGGQLVEAFVADVRRAQLPGVHVVTGRGLRNVTFYNRLGFMERGSALSNGREVILLGRDIA
jgi:GNAT superfamily N-acetyltransferase